MDSKHFDVTQDERAAGSLSADKLDRIRHSFETDGYAVVSGLISSESCDLLTQAVLEDVEQIRSRPDLTLHEQRTGVGHLQLGLRRYAPYVRPDLVANPLIESIVSALLGKGAWLGFYNGNVNTPAAAISRSTWIVLLLGKRKKKRLRPASLGPRRPSPSLARSLYLILRQKGGRQRFIPAPTKRPHRPHGRHVNGSANIRNSSSNGAHRAG